MQRRQSTGTGAGGGGAGSPLLNLLQGAVGVAGQDKAAKQALYHALALLSVTGACWCCWALCQVLEPFFRPLVWAGLVGCLLHPLKRAVAKGLTRWLQTHSPSSSNLLLALLFSPLHLTDCTLRTLDSSVAKYWKASNTKYYLSISKNPILLLFLSFRSD